MKIPHPLLDDISQGRCLPVTGAGFSLNAKMPEGFQLPDWATLGRELAKRAGAVHVTPQEAAALFERQFGRVQLIETIRQALRVDEIESDEVHRSFAGLPFDTVYTTNFDLLLEGAYSSIRRPYRSLVGELQLPFHGGSQMTSIVKMHGDLRHEEHVIVTAGDYAEYIKNYPVIATHLSAMLITRTALYIGYSLTDPDFLQIRDVVRARLGKFERMGYMVQFNVGQSREEELLKQKLHIINLRSSRSRTRAEALLEFFRTIQEHVDSQQAHRMRSLRPDVFDRIGSTMLTKTISSTDSGALLSSQSDLCFVLLPFRPEFDEVYRDLIVPAARSVWLKPLRADDIYAPGQVIEQIRVAIQQARLCVADITGANPNVLYEMGIAHTLGKPTIVLAKSIDDVPFDLRSTRVIIYGRKAAVPAREQLQRAFAEVLGEKQLAEAKQLLTEGRYRAAVAIASVFLEHSLRKLMLRNLKDVSDVLQGRDAVRVGLASMLKALRKAGIVQERDSAAMKPWVALRNRAVHALEEPSRLQAQQFIEAVDKFVQKYEDHAGRGSW